MKEMGLPEAPAGRLAEKVWDVTEFILDNFDSLEPQLDPTRPSERVTYHAPCHLRNHGRGKEMVETLLERLPNVEYRRAPDRDACCGGGGMFFNTYPDISKKMVDDKIRNAEATGAGIWTTGCPGCRVQLSGNLPRKGMFDVRHPVEVVSHALRP
jgi:glycolate oxidase iron-sulfur subunit